MPQVTTAVTVCQERTVAYTAPAPATTVATMVVEYVQPAPIYRRLCAACVYC